MRNLIQYLNLSILLITINVNYSQSCDTTQLVIDEIRASDTDPNIAWELAKHYVYHNPSCVNGKLLVHFVGSYDNPLNTTYFPTIAANEGFKVIVLKYPNSVAAKTACGSSSDVDCFYNFRKEIIEGIDVSPDVDVSSIECINNRLLKLLIYLNNNYPNEGWNNYYSGNLLIWDQMILSGHSQGGGHAALIAAENEVYRVISFASPNDYSNFYNAPANWTSMNKQSHDSCYYSFGNLNDEVVDFSEQYSVWNNLGQLSYGDTIIVENQICPFQNTHSLYTTNTTTSSQHSSVVRDSDTPLDINNLPVYVEAWRYLLGASCPVASNGFTNFLNDHILLIFYNSLDRTLNISGMKIDIDYCIEIIDLTGKLVVHFNSINQTEFIYKDQLQSGIYLINITPKGKQPFTYKLNIQ
ncbi:MAG: T9SS type A sorting domain-containing protein [Flavobacteriales bacterium]|nr:T9SS type A sorting domain-containing protein [Flavobacteriales bacterium]MCB9197263.1 T9SS type A sorting domain-containing protein [Flavobacteriales bacterium]